MTFQQTVTTYPSLGREGSFASANPRYAAMPVEGGFRAGANGVTVARFVWLDDKDPTLVNNTTSVATAKPIGLIHNDGKAVIGINESASMLIPSGCDVAVYSICDMWVRTTTAATIGQKVFAVTADGTIATGDAGATVAGAVETDFVVVGYADAKSLVRISRGAV